jgi:hypothetical protein
VIVAGRKKKQGMFGVEAVPWDTPANAVSLADLRLLDAIMADMGTLFGNANDDKALGESQAKFNARRSRKKAGPRQRRAGG